MHIVIHLHNMNTTMPPQVDPKTMSQDLRRRYAMMGLTSSTAIAARTGINQSQVHRNLFGRPRRVSKTLKKLCVYVELIEQDSTPDPRASDVLMQALGGAWDGTAAHAQRIADMLLSIRLAKL